jgi:putative nucleotidyltransferase with HDIG domain
MMKDRDQGLWEHSMGVATASSLVAQAVHLPDTEEASLAGLLHDLGKVVLRAQMTEDMQSIAELVEVEGLSVRQAEREVLGFDHSQIGQWLAESWKLPQELIEPIRWHHQPEGARQNPRLTAVVHLADIMVRGYGYGDGGDPWVPELDPGVVQLLDLTPQKLEKVVDGICQKLVGAGADIPGA